MGVLIGLYTIFAGVTVVVTIVIIVVIVKTIVNIIESEDINNNSKLFWVVLILATNLLGLIIYAVTSNKNVLN